MSTTTRSRIVLPLPRLLSERHDRMMSLLASGWVQVTYKKANGQIAVRLATRNPTLVAAYGHESDRTAISRSDTDWNATGIVYYYDYTKGSIRSFYVEDVIEVAIPADAPENNH
jgi:hypothetical protein